MKGYYIHQAIFQIRYVHTEPPVCLYLSLLAIPCSHATAHSHMPCVCICVHLYNFYSHFPCNYFWVQFSNGCSWHTCRNAMVSILISDWKPLAKYCLKPNNQPRCKIGTHFTAQLYLCITFLQVIGRETHIWVW